MVYGPATDPQEMIEGIRRALAQHPALSEAQRADVAQLCDEICELHRDGKLREAANAQHLAMSIIHQGAAAPE
jgi:AraC-like DNA-binding protein